MRAHTLLSFYQQITATDWGALLLPVCAGLAVLYMVYAFFFHTKSTSEAIVDRPELQVALSNFLSDYFADEWDTVESQIEIDHFKHTFLDQPDACRLVLRKLLAPASPYRNKANQPKLTALVKEWNLDAFVVKELASANESVTLETLEYAKAIPSLQLKDTVTQLAFYGAQSVRTPALATLIELCNYQPDTLRIYPHSFTEEDMQNLVALYSDQSQWVAEQLPTWLEATEPQFLWFCLALAKEYQLPVEMRSLQQLAFHAHKSLGAIAIQLLDGYLQPESASALQQYRKKVVLEQPSTEAPTANENSLQQAIN
ncbi:hypothetical protein [Flavobacterium sp.]|uniref:hypothetical protein n=1 Tax=Flavobacterium sp. TaxID=239 RepID=UPI00334104EE